MTPHTYVTHVLDDITVLYALQRSEDGNNAFMLAAARWHTDCMQALIAAGALLDTFDVQVCVARASHPPA